MPVLDEIAERLAQVRADAGDGSWSPGSGNPEGAHWEEDNLHQFVLRCIADGRVADLEEARSAAALALTSQEINFERVHA